MYLITLITFIYGVVIGSFLNVVIYRIPLEKKLTGRSKCPSCNHTLSALELVPIFSYLAQGRKCKKCKEKISPRYMSIELLTGVLFAVYAFVLSKYGAYGIAGINFYANLVIGCIITSSLISVAFIDIDTMMIPDRFHIILIASSLALTLVNKGDFVSSITSGLIIGGIMFAVAFITLGLGLGDVKLLFASGMLFGAYNTNIVLVIASFSAIAYALIRKIKKGVKFPFGPHIAVGMYVMLVFIAGQII